MRLPHALRSEKVAFVTTLTPAECVARLRDTVDKDGMPENWLWHWPDNWLWHREPPGQEPVIGRLTKSSMRLRKRRPSRRNLFQDYLTARLRQERGGTVISGRVGPPLPAMVYMAAWWVVAILLGGFGLLAFWGVISDTPASLGARLFGTFVILFLWVLPPAVIAHCRRSALGEAGFLKAFLMETLEASPKRVAQ